MNQDKQRIGVRRIESGRDGIEAMNALAATRGNPKLAQRLPVDARHALAVEMGEWRPPPAGGIDAHDFGGAHRALPPRRKLRRALWGGSGDVEKGGVGKRGDVWGRRV